MASITMTASLLSGATFSGQRSAASHRRLIITNATGAAQGERMSVDNDTKKESANGRRDLVFAAAAAAVCSVAGIALAEEPKRGSLEAKKKYAPVCVTMPTARICRN